MADTRALCNALPITAPAFQQLAHFKIKRFVHDGASIAKFCGSYTQHFALATSKTDGMKKFVNQVIAEALAYYMADRWNQTTLGKAAEVTATYVNGETTVIDWRRDDTAYYPAATVQVQCKIELTVVKGMITAFRVTSPVSDWRTSYCRRIL